MTATQQSQMIIEAVGDFRGGKDTHPRRGQLDSQRDAVHPANDRLDRSGDILAQLEPWSHVAGSIGEKPGRVGRPCFTGVAALLHGQRGHWPHQLARDVERGTARGQDRHGRAPAQQHLGHPPGRIQDVLAAVKHQQGRCLAQVLHRRLQRRAARSAAHRFEHGAVDQAGVGQRGELDQVDACPTQVSWRWRPAPGPAGSYRCRPMPTSVTSRFPSRNSDLSSSSSRSRPTKAVMDLGRAPVTSTSCASPTQQSWHA